MNHEWEIHMAQTADNIARKCCEYDSRRLEENAPSFRQIAFNHRKKAREMLE